MKKKLVSCLCMAIVVVSLLGCGDSAKTDNSSTDETVVSVSEEKESTIKKADEKTTESSSEADEKEGTFYILCYDGSRCSIPTQPDKEYYYYTDDTKKKYRDTVFCDYGDYLCIYSDSAIDVDKNNGISLDKMQRHNHSWLSEKEVKSTDINGKTIYYGYFPDNNNIYAYEDVGNSTYIEMYISIRGDIISEDEAINIIKEFVIQ